MARLALAPAVLAVLACCAPLVCLACGFSRLADINEITDICCESLANDDCSAGFPLTCTSACADVIVPFWEECGTFVSGLSPETFEFELEELAIYAGNCKHTRALLHFSGTGCDHDEASLEAQINDIQESCCVQNGENVCVDGTPWRCDAECAIPFMTFFANCIEPGVMSVADLTSYRTLYKSCMHLDEVELGVLIGTLDSLVSDPHCLVNTSQITSFQADIGGLPEMADGRCVDDDEAVAEAFGDSEFTCATALATSMCSVVNANSPGACSCSCPANGAGPICHNDDEGLAEAFGDPSFTCTSAAVAGMCSVVDANAPGMCGCSCTPSLVAQSDGHRRDLQAENTTNSTVGDQPRDRFRAPRFLPFTANYLHDSCPLDSIDDQLYAISEACCTDLTPCPAREIGIPAECTFDCNRIYAPFLNNCHATIAALTAKHPGGQNTTMILLEEYAHTCQNFSVASMATAVLQARCDLPCEDGYYGEMCELSCLDSVEPADSIPATCCVSSCAEMYEQAADAAPGSRTLCNMQVAGSDGRPCTVACGRSAEECEAAGFNSYVAETMQCSNVVVGSDGNGGTFEVPSRTDMAANAMAACEAHYGVGTCGRGCGNDPNNVPNCGEVVTQAGQCSGGVEWAWCLNADSQCSCGWGSARHSDDNGVNWHAYGEVVDGQPQNQGSLESVSGQVCELTQQAQDALDTQIAACEAGGRFWSSSDECTGTSPSSDACCYESLNGCSPDVTTAVQVEEDYWLCGHLPNLGNNPFDECNEELGFHLTSVGPMSLRGKPSSDNWERARGEVAGRGHHSSWSLTGQPVRGNTWNNPGMSGEFGFIAINNGVDEQNWNAYVDGNSDPGREWPNAASWDYGDGTMLVHCFKPSQRLLDNGVYLDEILGSNKEGGGRRVWRT